MSGKELPGVEKDDTGRVSSVVDSEGQRIQGPLGIWPWPILNLIAQLANSSENKVVITEINRDSSGRIQSIEEFRR